MVAKCTQLSLKLRYFTFNFSDYYSYPNSEFMGRGLTPFWFFAGVLNESPEALQCLDCTEYELDMVLDVFACEFRPTSF